MKVADQLKYSHFYHRLDVDAVEEALGFEPTKEGHNKHGESEDIGHCLDPWSLHKNGDTTGKFALNRDRCLYNCFVCGGGTLLDLAMAVRGIEEQEAEEWLYQFTAPSEQSGNDFLSEIDAILYQERIAKPPMPYYNEHVLDKWTVNLVHLEGWLRERGIADQVAVSASLGFQRAAMRMAPLKDGKAREQPYIGPAVCFPHFWGGRLVGWQQRWLDEDRPKWIPKYTNTSNFPKSETIYNYENVYLGTRPVIVCESVPTVLFLASLGYPAVGTFGSSVTLEQMRLLRRFQYGVVLAVDNDQPGYKWLRHTDAEIRYNKTDRPILAQYLAEYIPVKVMDAVGEYDSGNDLADLLDEGLRFAAKAVKVLYDEAEYYYPTGT